jgi:hypothetical protein
MAIVHGEESSFMLANIQSARVGAVLFFILYVIGLIYAYVLYLRNIKEEPLVAFLAFLIIVSILTFVINKIGNYLVSDFWNNIIGLRSEGNAFLELKDLPAEYHIFRNVKFDHMYDIDFVVVGPRGVFVFEVNSIRGNITSNDNALYVNGCLLKGKDRLKQALRNTLEVSNYLDGKYFVQGAVVFAHYKSKLDIGFRKVQRVNVIKHQWLKKFILEESDNQFFSSEQQQLIVEKLILAKE